MLKDNFDNKEFTLRVKGHNYVYGGFTSRKFIASFVDQLNVGHQVYQSPCTITPPDMLKLLTTLDTAVSEGEFDITSEEKEVLKRMLARQQLQTKFPQTSGSSLHVEKVESANPVSPVVDVQIHAPSEINTSTVNIDANLSVPLADENEWQMLLQDTSGTTKIQSFTDVKRAPSSSAAETTMHEESSVAAVGLKQQGKDRAENIKKKSPKVVRKLL